MENYEGLFVTLLGKFLPKKTSEQFLQTFQGKNSSTINECVLLSISRVAFGKGLRGAKYAPGGN
jgi:hypothetical protein